MTSREPRDPAAERALSLARSAQLAAVGTAFLRIRPLVVAPMMAATLTILAFSGVPGRQIAALAAGMSALLAMFVAERRAGSSGAISPGWFARSLAITAAGIGVGCAGSGGAGSPLLPILFAPAGVAFAAFGRGRASGAMLLWALVVLGGLSLLPDGTPFPPLPRSAHRLVLLLAVADALVLLRVGVGGLSDAHARAEQLLSLLREQAVAEAEARARSLEALGAKVAHEIKNPLSSVKGLVELMAEEAPDARWQKRLGVAAGEVTRIEQILRDYLSFARPLGNLRPAPVELRALCDEVGELLGARAARAGVSLEAKGPSQVIEADSARLKEALLNLASNALEASTEGGRVTLEVSEGEREGAQVAVIDRGRGMGESELEKLGTPYWTTREQGTGLGVVLARSAIEQHGGRLTFESAPGRGTTALVRLPRRAARGASHGKDPAG